MHFQYSYSSGKFKHTYTGSSLSKVVYTRHDIPCRWTLPGFHIDWHLKKHFKQCLFPFHFLNKNLNCSKAVIPSVMYFTMQYDYISLYCVQQLSFHQSCPLLHSMITFGILFSSCYSTRHILYDAVWLCLVNCYSIRHVPYYAVWLYLIYCSTTLFHQSYPPICCMITLGKFFTGSYSTIHVLCCVVGLH